MLRESTEQDVSPGSHRQHFGVPPCDGRTQKRVAVQQHAYTHLNWTGKQHAPQATQRKKGGSHEISSPPSCHSSPSIKLPKLKSFSDDFSISW
mmetsp:Transcript_21187/g.48894  ORF Transcript_21187/g.48894 Transcript_21187/m.48894 type:complete len:93 (+) Transcript_21187:98-376(+)